jgi:DNA-binding transcriptional ArsR family regulator
VGIDEAVDALERVIRRLNLRLLPPAAAADHPSSDLILLVDERRIALNAKYYALVDESRALKLIRDMSSQSRTKDNETSVPLIIGDRIVSGAREILRDANVSWFDLRGHLHLTAAGLRVDVDTESSIGSTPQTKPIAGQVGLSTAVDLLLHQPDRASVRETARRIGAAPSTVSTAMRSLRRAGLMEDDGSTDLKALFWVTAREWSPEWIPVGKYPDATGPMRNPALELRLDDPESPGWAMGGDYAAAQLGAPIGLAAGGPPDFYVPSIRTHRLASSILGEARGTATPAARLAVAPVRAVCERRISLASSLNEHWLIARPLFIALDLAQDRGRGTEILESWDPGMWGTRVW